MSKEQYYRILVPESPFPSDNPKILFSMKLDKYVGLFEAKKLIETTSFNLKKDNWVFVECECGMQGQRAGYIKEEE